MSCSACVARVEKAIKSVDGVTACSVNLLTGIAEVDGGEDEKIISAVVKEGYGGERYTNSGLIANEEKNKNGKIRLILSALFLVFLVYVSMGEMIGLFLPSFLSGDKNALYFAIFECLLAAVIIAINFKYYISGFKSLIKLKPNMDSLVAVGSSFSFLYGLYIVAMMIIATVNSNIGELSLLKGNLFFESSAMILVFVSLGKFIEGKSKKKTTKSLEKLLSLIPDKARVLIDGKEEVVLSSELKKGDIVLIKPGDKIPADCVIIGGETFIDQSLLTGESLPVYKGLNDKMAGGAINKSGSVTARVTDVGEDSALGKIIDYVSKAMSEKPPIARLADRLAGIFTPVVMALSTLTFILWIIFSKDFSLALNMGISVMVVSCPCAMGLATPVAVTVATGLGAEKGVLFKNGEAIETLSKVDTVIFDKTGTLTEGKPFVDYFEEFFPCKKEVYSVEKLSEHPFATSIAKNFEGEESLSVDKFKAVSGKGVYGVAGGREVYIGNESFVSPVCDIDSNVRKKAEELSLNGSSPLFISVGGKLSGLIALSDRIKKDSVSAVKTLLEMKKKVVMITGDNKVVAAAVAKKLNIDDFYAEVLPSEKADVIKKISKDSITAFVGDGINDAPALTVANVGISIGGGTDVAKNSSSVVLTGTSIKGVVTALTVSKKAVRIIKQNLFWAFFYNVLCIPLAGGALFTSLNLKLTPAISAAMMSLSSIFVVTNALRLKLSFKNKENDMKKKITLKVEKMMCEHCAARVKAALEEIDGVSAKVILKKKEVILKASGDVFDDIIREKIENAGYVLAEIIK